LIDEYPDRFMRGTDWVGMDWNYDADFGLLLAKPSRAPIDNLGSSGQEKFACQNAENLLQ